MIAIFRINYEYIDQEIQEYMENKNNNNSVNLKKDIFENPCFVLNGEKQEHSHKEVSYTHNFHVNPSLKEPLSELVKPTKSIINTRKPKRKSVKRINTFVNQRKLDRSVLTRVLER